MIVDTHAHLTDPSLSVDIVQYLELAKQAGVTAVLCVGTTLQSSQQAIELAEQHPQIRAAVGLHPNNCCQSAANDWDSITQLCLHPRVAALGETGLDRHWDDCPWEVQVDYFCRHLQLSRETRRPLVIHTRDCAEETLAILRRESRGEVLLGVMHSFTGPQAVADGCLELGLYISFAGMLTYKNAEDIREIARRVPADRILIETDSPYLTPHPLRGQRPNHPALVAYTLHKLAEVRHESVSELAKQTTINAERLFGPW